MGTSDARRPRAVARDDDLRWRRVPPVLSWWQLRAASIAGWALFGFVLTYAVGVLVARGDGGLVELATGLAMAAGVAGVIAGAVNLGRSPAAAAVGLGAGVLLASSLPDPAGLGLLTGPLGIASPLVAAVVAVAALAYGLWRGTDGSGEDEPENRAFAPPGERRRLLRRGRRRR